MNDRLKDKTASGEAIEAVPPSVVATRRAAGWLLVAAWLGGCSDVGEVAPGAGQARAVGAERAPAEVVPPAADRLGLALSEAPPDLRRQLRVDYGLVVETVTGAPAAESAIGPGDVIVTVNQHRFTSLPEFDRLIAREPPGLPLALLVRRDGLATYVVMTAPQRAES